MHLFTKLFYKLRAFGSGVNRLLLKISVALYGNRQYLMHWSNRQLWLWKRLPYPEKCMLCHLKSALFVYDLCCKTKIIEAVIVYFWKKVIDNRVFLHCRYRLFYFCRYGLLYLCLHRIFYLSLSSSPSVCCFFCRRTPSLLSDTCDWLLFVYRDWLQCDDVMNKEASNSNGNYGRYYGCYFPISKSC